MKLSQYLMGPAIALGLTTACTTKDSSVKPTPANPRGITKATKILPGAECVTGGTQFTYSDKKTETHCNPEAEAKKDNTPAPAPAPAADPGIVWNSNLDVLEGSAGTAFADQVAKVQGNLRFDLKGMDTPLMPKLEEVTGDVTIGVAVDAASGVEANNTVTNLNGLAKLRVIKGNLVIRGNAQLKDLSGLAALEEVGNIVIDDNAALEEFNLPAKIKSIKILEVENNHTLKSIKGDNALEKVAGELNIEANPLLTDLSAFAKVTTVKKATIKSNDQLGTLAGFAALTKAENFTISQNGALLDVSGLKSLEEVTGELEIHENAILGSEKGAVVGLPALRKVKKFTVTSNLELQKLGNFGQFAEANEYFVKGNAKLNEIIMPALKGVEKLQIGSKPSTNSEKASGSTEGVMNARLVGSYEEIFQTKK